MSTPILTRSSRIVPTFTIADRLRKAREIAGYDQEEMAAASGISRGTITNAETGRSAPHRSTLALWSAATGVSLAWLETGEAPSDESDEASAVRLKGLEPPTF